MTMTQTTIPLTDTLTDLAAHAATAPAATSGAKASDHMDRQLVRAHANAGRLYCDRDLTTRTVRALTKRGLAEPVHQTGRTDARKVIIGMHLTIRGTREALRVIQGGAR